MECGNYENPHAIVSAILNSDKGRLSCDVDKGNHRIQKSRLTFHLFYTEVKESTGSRGRFHSPGTDSDAFTSVIAVFVVESCVMV